jgi:hypothetical protein
MYIVEKIMQIRGTIMRMIFNKLSIPFEALFSRLKILRDIMSNKAV